MFDGRSNDPIRRYFPIRESIPSWEVESSQDLSSLEKHDSLLLVTGDYQDERRQGFDQILRKLEGSFSWVNSRVEYPLFEILFERKQEGIAGYPLLPGSGQISQPLAIYGLEFQDLALPVEVEVAGTGLNIAGAFYLPDSQGSRQVEIPLAEPISAQRLLLVTSLLEGDGIATGATVAEVVLTTSAGQEIALPLRKGIEVQSWDQDCLPESVCKSDCKSACETVFEWHKRLALLGQQAYPGAWRDFQARLHGTALVLTTRDLYWDQYALSRNARHFIHLGVGFT